MQNGRLTFLRVVLSGLLAVIALVGAIWLLHDTIPIPSEYWLLTIVGIAGVTGLDLAAYLLKKKGDDND